jgi:Tol biopolymer transport system component
MSDRDGNDDVFVMGADGSQPHNLTNTPRLHEAHPSWTRDGRLSFLRFGESEPVTVRVVRADGSRPHDLAVDAAFVFDWTP